MTFTTLTFLVFLAIVFSLYWSVRSGAAQNKTLLLASYGFYSWWDWRFCFLMLASSLVDYELAKRIDQSSKQSHRRWLLRLSIVSNLGLLASFKYFNFFVENLIQVVNQIGWSPDLTTLSIILPLGISFYTFQTLGYTIDVYRKQLAPAKNVVDYLAFVSFFPQLVAGPIERASHMLPQFAIKRAFDQHAATDGVRQMLWGFFKKMVIADRLALAVNPVFDNPAGYSGPHLMMGTVFFAFQIYCDFSAYSDIAIGTAKLFNIRLSQNFAYPYFSQSIGEFWRRWHISLSYWFRDYVYIPLGGNRKGRVRYRVNLLLTFLLSGLWHGAAWNFVAWGGVNGLAVGLPIGGSRKQQRLSLQKSSDEASNDLIRGGSERSVLRRSAFDANTALNGMAIVNCDSVVSGADAVTHEPGIQGSNPVHDSTSLNMATPGGDRLLPRPGTLLRIYGTFAVLCVAWVLFRAATLTDALLIYQRIVEDILRVDAYRELSQLLDADRYQRKTATFLLAFVCWEWLFRRQPHSLRIGRFPTVIRWTLYTILIWSTLYLMPKTGTGEFVYFEF